MYITDRTGCFNEMTPIVWKTVNKLSYHAGSRHDNAALFPSKRPWNFAPNIRLKICINKIDGQH